MMPMTEPLTARGEMSPMISTQRGQEDTTMRHVHDYTMSRYCGAWVCIECGAPVLTTHMRPAEALGRAVRTPAASFPVLEGGRGAWGAFRPVGGEAGGRAGLAGSRGSAWMTVLVTSCHNA